MKSFFKKHLWLILVVLLATVLRFYNLSSNPPSLSWDEAAIGWNAKSMFHTRRDEFGTRLPLAFRSFGDYKAPLYIYLTAPVVGFFGLTEINIRLVSVLAGIASIVVIYLITEKLFNKKTALVSAALLAITPWSILISRGAFEQNLALFFILLGIYWFITALKKTIWLIPSAISFGLSLYTYHSPKIFVPIFVLSSLLIYRKKLFTKKTKYYLLSSAILGIVLLLPLIKATFTSSAALRFTGTSIFYKNDVRQPFTPKLFTQLAKNYLVHYSPSFYWQGVSDNFRTQTKDFGLLLTTTAPFLIYGLYIVIKNRQKDWAKFLLAWLFIGPIAAAIGRENPHPIRAMNMLPALLIITALGTTSIIKQFKSLKPWIIALLLINLSLFLNHYFTQYSIYSASDWQYGYKQVAEIAKKYENQVNKIVITSHYGQPHIFNLVYQNRDPAFVFNGGMVKYIYYDISWFDDSRYKDVLLIGSPKEIPETPETLIKQINFPDGSPAFRVVKTKGDVIIDGAVL
ncbi:ArnT family glycosyltransferase [Patescibacteria group bacterium]